MGREVVRELPRPSRRRGLGPADSEYPATAQRLLGTFRCQVQRPALKPLHMHPHLHGLGGDVSDGLR